ncbi:hypothetical protein GQS40_06985|uniref:Adenylosuccinate synthetase n=1 Tax=Leuconostoc lactis TaxID=1246 RepID=A0A6L7AAD3_LEULA|nr:hypothetical protein [Leuconostoc lactis]
MSGVIVVGSQWGDEGKGKIVDFFAEDADAVVRYLTDKVLSYYFGRQLNLCDNSDVVAL